MIKKKVLFSSIAKTEEKLQEKRMKMEKNQRRRNEGKKARNNKAKKFAIN